MKSLIRSLFGWWASRPAREVEVVLYTRKGCHLCDDAYALLAEEQRRRPMRLTLVDIDQEPDLVEQYNQCVPVVQINGKVRFRGRVNRVLLRRQLEADARREEA